MKQLKTNIFYKMKLQEEKNQSYENLLCELKKND